MPMRQGFNCSAVCTSPVGLCAQEYPGFIAGLCEEFELQPGGTTTRARFLEVLKAQLQAAAAAADQTTLQQLSTGKQSALSADAGSGSGPDAASAAADTPFAAYGVLTGPQARLRQHTLRRQQTLQGQTSRLADGLSAGPLGVRGTGQPQMQVSLHTVPARTLRKRSKLRRLVITA